MIYKKKEMFDGIALTVRAYGTLRWMNETPLATWQEVREFIGDRNPYHVFLRHPNCGAKTAKELVEALASVPRVPNPLQESAEKRILEISEANILQAIRDGVHSAIYHLLREHKKLRVDLFEKLGVE